MTGLPKGDGIPRPKTGHYTASIMAHDGQTEQLGSLLAMTVGSYHLKNSLQSLKPGIKIQKDFHGLSTYCFRLETSLNTIPMADQREESQLSDLQSKSALQTRDFSLDKNVLGQICWGFRTQNHGHVFSLGVGQGKLVNYYEDLLYLL